MVQLKYTMLGKKLGKYQIKIVIAFGLAILVANGRNPKIVTF